MSMYTTAQLLAANEQKFKFDPLFLRLFFRESYPFTTEKVYLSQIPGLVNMALYVSPIVSGEVIRSRGGSTSEFTPGYVKPKHEVNPQMTLRRLPDEDPQNLADPAYRRRRIIMQNMRDEELAIAQVEEMQAVSAVLKGKYTMTGEAFDPVEVDIAPPDIPAGFVAVFNSDESSWHLVEDHRGKTVYDVASGDALFISELGPLPENVTWLSPEGEFQKWNGTAWVKDAEAEKLFRIREAEETKNSLMQVASEHIAPLQDAVDLEIATEEETSLLEAWKKYRVLLNRVDTSTAPDIEWPTNPVRE
ncbi:hypothetical protein FV460_02655 [Escherichia coli]|nr:hypothetical protein FV460_02655 [Escherichia coli]